jgi:hypothetical protein
VHVREGNDAHAKQGDAQSDAVEPPQTIAEFGFGTEDEGFAQAFRVCVPAVMREDKARHGCGREYVTHDERGVCA